MKNWIRITAVAVIISFIYSDIVRAGGLPTETISPDTKGFITELGRYSGEQLNEARVLTQLLSGKSLEEKFTEIAGRIKERSDKEFRDVCKTVIFTLFAPRLKESDLREENTEITGVDAEGRIILISDAVQYALYIKEGEICVDKIGAEKGAEPVSLVNWRRIHGGDWDSIFREVRKKTSLIGDDSEITQFDRASEEGIDAPYPDISLNYGYRVRKTSVAVQSDAKKRETKDLAGRLAKHETINPRLAGWLKENDEEGRVKVIDYYLENGRWVPYKVKYVENYTYGMDDKWEPLSAKRYTVSAEEQKRLNETLQLCTYAETGKPVKFRVVLGETAVGWMGDLDHSSLVHVGESSATIWLGEGLFRDLLSKNSDPLRDEIFRHEKEHLRGNHGVDNEDGYGVLVRDLNKRCNRIDIIAKTKSIIYTALAGLVILLGIANYTLTFIDNFEWAKSMGDFFCYLGGAKDYLDSGTLPYGNDVSRLERYHRGIGSYIGSPINIILFYPLVLLSKFTSLAFVQYTFFFASITVWLSLFILLEKVLVSPKLSDHKSSKYGLAKNIIIYSLLFNLPFLQNLCTGQINILYLAPFIAAIIIYVSKLNFKGKTIIIGFLLALAGWIKIFPWIILVAFMLPTVMAIKNHFKNKKDDYFKDEAKTFVSTIIFSICIGLLMGLYFGFGMFNKWYNAVVSAPFYMYLSLPPFLDYSFILYILKSSLSNLSLVFPNGFIDIRNIFSYSFLIIFPITFILAVYKFYCYLKDAKGKKNLLSIFSIIISSTPFFFFFPFEYYYQIMTIAALFTFVSFYINKDLPNNKLLRILAKTFLIISIVNLPGNVLTHYQFLDRILGAVTLLVDSLVISIFIFLANFIAIMDMPPRETRVKEACPVSIKIIEKDSVPCPKARVGNELENAGEVAWKVLEGNRGWIESQRFIDGQVVRYMVPQDDFQVNFDLAGVNYEVIHSNKRSYFIVKLTKDGITTEKKVFVLPLPDGNDVMVTAKLWEKMLGKPIIEDQIVAHENFEKMNEAQRIRFMDFISRRLLTDPADKEHFISLWRRMGIELVFTDGNITGINPLTDNARRYLGHLGGEIMELVSEYVTDKGRVGYKQFSDVSISSLDAFLLGIMLMENLGIEIDIDRFTEKMVKPGNVRRVVLGMTADKRLNMDVIEDALDAVKTASGSVDSIEDYTTKATLVLADEWSWRIKEIGTLEELFGKDILSKIRDGLKANGYEFVVSDIERLLVDIRRELGRLANMENHRISLSNPYLHAVIGKIAEMAGIQPQVLVKVLYNDLVEETKNMTNGMKSRIVNSAVENALVDMGIVVKRGILSFESLVSAKLSSDVRKLAIRMYSKNIPNTEQPANPIDLALNVDKDRDIFGVVEEMLGNAVFKGAVLCRNTMGGLAGVAPLLGLLDLERSVSCTAYTVPKELEKEGQSNNLVISMEHLFTVDSVDTSIGAVTLTPKAIDVKGTIRKILTSGGNVKIICNPQKLGMIPETARQAVMQEAVEKYLGLDTLNFPGLSIEVKTACEVISELGDNAKKTKMILTKEDTANVESNNGAFIYVPQSGELLRDVITVTAAIDFDRDGRFSERSRDIILDYLKKQIPGIDKDELVWQEIIDAVGGFNNNSVLFFRLPSIVRFTERLNDLGLYKITVLVAA